MVEGGRMIVGDEGGNRRIWRGGEGKKSNLWAREKMDLRRNHKLLGRTSVDRIRMATTISARPRPCLWRRGCSRPDEPVESESALPDPGGRSNAGIFKSFVKEKIGVEKSRIEIKWGHPSSHLASLSTWLFGAMA
jgi:hypothetical protein